MTNLIKNNERVDKLHRNGYQIIQNPNVFCFGMDAVLLADFAKAKKNEYVLDIGTGTGIIPILMEARYSQAQYVGIDIQEKMVEMSRRSIRLNGLNEKIDIQHLDVKNLKEAYEPNSFDVVTSNPPYMRPTAGIVNENESKMISRHEVCCSLEDIVSGISYVLKDYKRAYFVHRPHRIVDLFALCRKYKLEPKRMRLVYPKMHKAANMVLVEVVKFGKPELIVEAPLIVYNDDGKYTDEIYEIYGMHKEK